jgi:predicted hydrocarbon binding protein
MKSILEQNCGFFMEFEMLDEMKSSLEQLFASGAFVIVAAMARACGRLFCCKMKSQNLSVEEVLENFCHVLGGWNWGDFSFSNLDAERGEGKLSVKNSFETRSGGAKGLVGCYFLSNFAVGFLSEVFGKNIAVKERKCASREGDLCEFEFQAVQNGE